MRRLILSLVLLGAAHSASALDASQVRGGWETPVNGVEHVLELHIAGTRISGTYCTACDDATTLAFVDGTLGPSGLSFVVTHVRDDGSTLYQDHMSGRVDGGHLLLSGRSGAPGGGDIHSTMRRDPRGPIPPAPPPAPGAAPPVQHYLQPAPWETMSADKLVGVWLSGDGAGKQYFIIRRVGDTLRGMVCGPCDNPYAFAALEDFYIQDDTVLFNIDHEDHGFGPLPYVHHVIAHIARHELHLDATQDNVRRVVSMTFLGPLPFAATARRGSQGAARATQSGVPRRNAR
ncbi:MAG: hypothetical protein ACREU2_04720 [Steroidobacteraceae bacterium]